MTDEPKQGVGAEPDANRKRYCVEIPVTIKVWVDADDSDQARTKASKKVMGHVQGPPQTTITYTKIPPPQQCWAGDDLLPSGEGENRLVSIYRLCWGYNSPHLDFSDFETEARELYCGLDDAAKRRANGAFQHHNIELSPPHDPFKLPPAWFGGDWSEEVFCGYDSGRRWNGWACPLLTERQVDLFIDIQTKHFGSTEVGVGTAVKWVERGGVKLLEVTDLSDPDEAYTIEPTLRSTTDGDFHLYDIGLGFTWDIYTTDEIVEHDKKIVGTHGV